MTIITPITPEIQKAMDRKAGFRDSKDGLPFYCKLCGLGWEEYQACEEGDCILESQDDAQYRYEPSVKIPGIDTIRKIENERVARALYDRQANLNHSEHSWETIAMMSKNIADEFRADASTAIEAMRETAKPLAYLASPYARYPTGSEHAFVDICTIAGALIQSGVMVYCPIAHSHPIAIYSNIKLHDYELWMPLDKMMLDRCDNLIVANMLGWQDSKGIKEEVEYFTATGKPIFDLNIKTMTMIRRISTHPIAM